MAELVRVSATVAARETSPDMNVKAEAELAACFLHESCTRLVFQDGRLRTITDELGYVGP